MVFAAGIGNGLADIDPDNWIVSNNDRLYVDTSMALRADFVQIISARNTKTGTFFEGVYDTFSYVLIGASILLFSFILSCFTKLSPLYCLLYTWKLLLKQDIGTHLYNNGHYKFFIGIQCGLGL